MMIMPPIAAHINVKKGGSLSSPVEGSKNAIGIVITMKIKITKRYLSTNFLVYKTIYLFDLTK